MGHPNGSDCGVLSRTSRLFNCKTFSDVEFRVSEGHEFKVFLAHKLILSMAGEGFAKIFYYGKSEAPTSITILDFTPHIFEIMLQYVYCDKINISSLEDAVDLVKLAKRYSIYDLMDKCNTYISRFEIDINTVFAKYELAVSNQCHIMLPKCRGFVCQNTKNVFESPKFRSASLLVVQDIVKLDDLSVLNEMEVIEAVVQWGQAECKRLKRPPDQPPCLRAAILPLFKHIRFLTLGVDEFLYFVETYNILKSVESTKLTAKILEKKTSITLPNEFSSICTPRKGLPVNAYSLPALPLAYPRSLETHSVESSYTPPSSHKSEANVNNFRQNRPKLIAYPNSLETINSASGSSCPPSFIAKFDESVSINNLSQNSPKLIAAPVQPMYSQHKAESPQPTSPPLYQVMPAKKNAPILKVFPQAKPKTNMAYEFPLHEMQKEMASAFANDVKCNATITMLRGTVLIHGIELRVKDLKTSINELIEVHLCISNKLTHKSNTHGAQLKNSTLELSLNEPYKVSPGNPLDVEVTIEDLKLNRCSVCRLDETFELNCGLGITAKISVNSNQSNGNDSFFFLISKIIYSIP